jgi:hypothetical protein
MSRHQRLQHNMRSPVRREQHRKARRQRIHRQAVRALIANGFAASPCHCPFGWCHGLPGCQLDRLMVMP